MAEDVVRRPLNMAEHPLRNLGRPEKPRDATFTDNVTLPSPSAAEARPGTSLLAAPADHVHPETAPFRVAARGVTTVASGARVTLAVVKRQPRELFPSGGFIFVAENAEGVSWESKVDGATDVATYHERTKNPDEFAFKAKNASNRARTIEWATVGLAIPPAPRTP